jgi:hypothetical protein
MSAADLRVHLSRLGAERLDAADAGLDANAAYMDSLEDDLADARHAYIVAALTEIATLRAELGGPLSG